ncbi:IS4 family transposase [Massilia cavernae]|uniref:IS4 family transposase n=1 Tax=Massilia cavernae TaxID=2320864 RepID=UPI0011C3D562|nr:IS4 family transposase [Massilia cavernae]
MPLFYSADDIRGTCLLSKQPKPVQAPCLNDVIRLFAQLSGFVGRWVQSALSPSDREDVSALRRAGIDTTKFCGMSPGLLQILDFFRVFKNFFSLLAEKLVSLPKIAMANDTSALSLIFLTEVRSVKVALKACRDQRGRLSNR